MANLWTKKNPFLSLWLSGANAVAGKMRGPAAAAMAKHQAAMMKQMTRAWTDAWLQPVKVKARR